MKIFQKYKVILGAFLATAISALIGISPVVAADIPDYRLQISPAKEDIGDLKPGQSYSGVLKVQNTGTKEFEFKVGVSPYSVTDEKSYAPVEAENQYTDIANWVKFSKTTGKVEPNGEVEVAYTVTVPADVPAGGQYAMLTAEIINNEGDSGNGSGITTINRVGMLLYSNVEGNTRKTGEVIENKIPTILFNPPVSATSIVSNTGNTHATARYVLEVCPLFSSKASDGTLCDEEVYTNRENPDTLTILPETRRLNTVTWQGSPKLGIFRVRQTVTIFGQSSETEKIIFLCPIWFAFIVILIIFCAIFWIITRIRARSRGRE